MTIFDILPTREQWLEIQDVVVNKYAYLFRQSYDGKVVIEVQSRYILELISKIMKVEDRLGWRMDLDGNIVAYDNYFRIFFVALAEMNCNLCPTMIGISYDDHNHVITSFEPGYHLENTGIEKELKYFIEGWREDMELWSAIYWDQNQDKKYPEHIWVKAYYEYKNKIRIRTADFEENLHLWTMIDFDQQIVHKIENKENTFFAGDTEAQTG